MSKRCSWPRPLGPLAAVLSAYVLSVAPAAAQSEMKAFDIAAQSLSKALLEFSRQSGVNVVVLPELVAGKTSPAVRGELAIEAVLTQLLEGSGLKVEWPSSNTVLLQQGAPGPEMGTAADRARTSTSSLSTELALDEIVVTGTHIRSAAPTSPVITLERSDIERGGYTTVQDAMARLPQNYSGTTATSAARAGSNLGFTTQIDLRGIGSEATLTLVNGRRVAAGAGDQARAVDISMLPLAAVERVDVLTDGASALYGSDAVAGVVNIVLRRDFDGAESSAQYGSNEHGGDNFLASQLFGTTWDAGSFMLAAQYDRRDQITAAELGFGSSDFRARGGGDFRVPGYGSPGTVYPAGYFDGEPFATVVGPGGEPVFFAALPPGGGNNLQLADLALNEMSVFETALLDATPQQENASVYLTAEHDLGAVTLFADGVVANRKTDFRLGNDVTFLFVPQSNAYSPFAEPVMVGYELADVGPITTSVESKGGFANLGARGFVGNSGWTWEVVGSRSRDEFETRVTSVDFIELDRRLASSDPNVAFNPFGDGSAQAAGVADAIRSHYTFTGTSELTAISALAQGALLRLPGGDLGIAAGAEYRDEEMSTRAVRPGLPDSVMFPGAGRSLKAIFAEANIPIVAASNAIRGARQITLSFAARHEEYSDFGAADNPKVGLLWQPWNDLSLKGSWGTSFRAPSLRELYAVSTTLRNYPVLDPRAPGGPRRVFVNLTFGGNPDLQEETAETVSVVAEYRPSWLVGAHFSVGYYDTRYEDRIRGVTDGITPQFLLTIEDRLPAGVLQRAANGTLTGIDTSNINSARTLISGYDLAAGYYFEAGAWGTFDLNAAATITSEFTDQLGPGAPVLKLEGTTGNPPEWRGRLSLAWNRGAWGASVGINHIDGMRNTSTHPDIVRRDVDSQTTVDVQLAFTPRSPATALLRGLSVRLGAINLFDEPPPFVDGTGGGFDMRNHVVEGRTLYVRLAKAFGEAAR